MNKTCEVMLERLTKQDKLPQLAKLMGVRVQEIKDTDIALELFHDWLFPMEEKNASPFILSLVDQVSFFNAGVPAPTLSFEETTGSSFLDENTTTYYGEDGLRRAVIRFLGNVVQLYNGRSTTNLASLHTGSCSPPLRSKREAGNLTGSEIEEA